jgi:phosphohistidine phosphatase SixA
VAVQPCPALRPGAPIAQILKALKDLPAGASEILLLGHEPTLSQWISELAFGEAGAAIHLKKGGLGKLAITELLPRGFATLEWLLTPGQMELMSGTRAK